jgi:hypothetical protein
MASATAVYAIGKFGWEAAPTIVSLAENWLIPQRNVRQTIAPLIVRVNQILPRSAGHFARKFIPLQRLTFRQLKTAIRIPLHLDDKVGILISLIRSSTFSEKLNFSKLSLRRIKSGRNFSLFRGCGRSPDRATPSY